ncbi:hypothetical protein, partial [Streptomyces sp. AK02-04a]|uniref:hypothetical protein n=1 Tax=Streptomyces sp. AK02-04a TaxID=3028649 RepID=UPI0029BAAC1D
MTARHKKLRKSSIAVANRYAAVTLSLGVALGIGAAGAVPAMAAEQHTPASTSNTNPAPPAQASTLNVPLPNIPITHRTFEAADGSKIDLSIGEIEDASVDLRYPRFDPPKAWYQWIPSVALIRSLIDGAHGKVAVVPAVKVTRPDGSVVEFSGLNANTRIDWKNGGALEIKGDIGFKPEAKIATKDKNGIGLELSGVKAQAKFEWSSETGLKKVEGTVGLDTKVKATYNGYGVEFKGLEANAGIGWSKENGLEISGKFDAKPEVKVNVPGLNVEASGLHVGAEVKWSERNGFEMGKGNLGFAPHVKFPIPETNLTLEASGLGAGAEIKYTKENGLELKADVKAEPQVTVTDRLSDTSWHVEGLKAGGQVSWSKAKGFEIGGHMGGDGKVKVENKGNSFEISGLKSDIAVSYGTKGSFKIAATDELSPTVKVETAAGYSGELKGLKIKGSVEYSPKDGIKVNADASVAPQLTLTNSHGDEVRIEGTKAGINLNYSKEGGWKFEGNAKASLALTVTPKGGTAHRFETPSLNAEFKNGEFTYKTESGNGGNLKNVTDLVNELAQSQIHSVKKRDAGFAEEPAKPVDEQPKPGEQKPQEIRQKPGESKPSEDKA